MRSTSSLLAGTMTASLIAGPSCLLCMVVAAVIASPEDLGMMSLGYIVLAAIILLVSIPLGFFFAALPVFFGAAVMSWLGRHVPESRAPFLWGAAGAGLAGLLSLPLLAPSPADLDKVSVLLIIAFPFTGAICALVCRRLTAWPDEI